MHVRGLIRLCAERLRPPNLFSPIGTPIIARDAYNPRKRLVRGAASGTCASPPPRLPTFTPDSSQAGKPYHGRDEGVAHCLKDPEQTESPEHIQRFRVPLEPGARVRNKGQPRLDDDHSDLVHGAFFKGVAAHASDVLDV